MHGVGDVSSSGLVRLRGFMSCRVGGVRLRKCGFTLPGPSARFIVELSYGVLLL